MASPGNRHCVSYIGTLSFRIPVGSAAWSVSLLSWAQPWALQNDWTDREAVWTAESHRHKEPCFRYGPGSSNEKRAFGGHVSDTSFGNTAVIDRGLHPRCCHLGSYFKCPKSSPVPCVGWPVTGITAQFIVNPRLCVHCTSAGRRRRATLAYEQIWRHP